MNTSDYVVQGVLAGNSAVMIIESMTQLKSDKARGLSKRMGIDPDKMLELAELDPTANGGYMEWLARLAKHGSEIPPRETLEATLSRFDQIKRVPSFQGDKNIMAYKTYADLEAAVGAAHNVTSRTEKDKQVRELWAQIQDRYPHLDRAGKPMMIGGYHEWLSKLVKAKDITLPEDAETVLAAIEKFEAAKKNPEFRKSKNILAYRRLSDLISALHQEDADASSVSSHEPIHERPGIKLISAKTVNGHYYDLYEITSSGVAAQELNVPAGKRGWCVKNPSTFTGTYGMGEKNPAYLFRKDGIPYALSDVKSASVMDQNDSAVLPPVIFELLYLDMPDKLKETIININPWTKKFKKAIMNGGPNEAIVQAFNEATTEGTYDKQWQSAVDAIEWMRTSQWGYPPPDAMEAVVNNPILAMAYATHIEKDRVPNLEQIVMKHPRALAGYYSYLRDKFPDGWPAMEEAMKTYFDAGIALPLLVYATKSGKKLPQYEKTLKSNIDIWNKYQEVSGEDKAK